MKTKLKSILAVALCAVGLAAFAEDPLGSKENPWLVGSPNEAGVEAWTNGMGRLDIDGTGAMMDFSASSPAQWADASFTEAVVGSNVTAIGASAFRSCPNLKTLVLNEQTPPTLGANNDFSKAKIFVPAGKAGAYRASEGWKAYKDAIKEMGSVEVDALSNTFALDLTAGDRVAKDVETLVVDPAWDETDPSLAKVFIDGEEEPRQYTVATNDTWETAALEPGRYELEMQTSCSSYPAGFWKVGDDWVVQDLPPSSGEGIFFESGKTHLILGTTTFTGDAPLEVEDGAKFEYGAGAGFKGGKLEAPRRYGKVDVEGGLYQIVEKIKGCADNPWEVGDGVEAYTNGTELVIVGEGTITDLSEIPADVKSVEITDATVKGAEENAFAGFNNIALTLPDNWQGELPDEGGNWYGATGVTLTRVPMAVKNVKVLQRYPWNGLVDVKFDLTGEGSVKVSLSVRVDGKKLKNPTVTSGTTFELAGGGELKGLKLTWDAGTDFGDDVVHEKIKVKLTVSPAEAD